MWIWQLIKDIGGIAGIIALTVLVKDRLSKYQIRPTHNQWQPLVSMQEAMRRAYERVPDLGDGWRDAHGQKNVLTGYGMALLQEGRHGRLVIYGKQPPSTIARPVPRELLEWGKFAEGELDWKTFPNDPKVDDSSSFQRVGSWIDISVPLLRLPRFYRRIRTGYVFE